MSLNQSIFEYCKMMKVNGFIEKLWTHNGFVYFKFKDRCKENPKKVINYQTIFLIQMILIRHIEIT